MPKIFISYRRVDSQDITDRIHEHMVRHFDEQSIFQDVAGIPFGVDFREYLQQEIDKCDTVLVIIGTDWSRILNERLAETNDFVRIEVETALNKKKLVIPVLVKGANMPSPTDLPETVRQLCYNNAARVRPNPDFKHDCEVLANNIRQYHESQSVKPQVSSVIPDFEPPDLSNILPEPFEWCFIPAGKVKLEAGGYISEGGETFDVSSFYMAKYPITNAQYARFIEAGGYKIRAFWPPGGWKIREKLGWTKPADDKWLWDNYPVIGISWYEAVAFRNWLVNTIYIPDTITISLPTEQQWQLAAQGIDNRSYPWGNEFDNSKANTADSGLQQTTPVTKYLQGATSTGLMDMCGNVLEWCLTAYVTGTTDAYIYHHDARRVLRGGSWLKPSTSSRVLDRGESYGSVRTPETGFRLIARTRGY